MSFTSFAVILSGVIPTPAGIGPFEFVYLLLFKPLVGNVDAVASVLLYRFVACVPFLIGLVYVAIEKRKSLRIEIEEIKRQTDENEKKESLFSRSFLKGIDLYEGCLIIDLILQKIFFELIKIMVKGWRKLLLIVQQCCYAAGKVHGWDLIKHY